MKFQTHFSRNSELKNFESGTQNFSETIKSIDLTF